MSVLASNIVRGLCIFLAGIFFFPVLMWKCRASESLFPGKTYFVFRWDEEISVAVFLAWIALVVVQVVRTWRTPVSETYRPAIRSTAIQHAIILCLAALMLDCGLTLLSCCLAAALYWMTAGVVMSRRPASPTRFDLAILRHGFWSLSLLVTSIAYWVQALLR